MQKSDKETQKCIGLEEILKYLVLMVVFLSVTYSAIADSSGPSSKIKIGVPTALTGEAATFGIDIKNALTLMNEKYGNKYEFIFEDERCDGKTAVSVAQKLIYVDHVKYTLGFPCNASFIPTAPIYERENVLVITSSATSGDLLDMGKGIFRLFPSDELAARLLFDYLVKRHKKIAILTEQNEFPVMMERTFMRKNNSLNSPMEIFTEGFVHGQTDLRTTILKLMHKGVEAIYVNANAETSFIPVVKQIRALKFGGALYSAYMPGSAVVLKELGSAVNGFIYVNLPMTDELVTEKGREMMVEFRERFGEPLAGFPVVPITFEAFRIFDLAIDSGMKPVEYLASTKFSEGFVPNFHFDEHGAVQGINFEMQKIENGKVVKVIE